MIVVSTFDTRILTDASLTWSMAPADPNPHAGYFVLHRLAPPPLPTPIRLTVGAAGQPVLRVETSPHAKIRMGGGGFCSWKTLWVPVILNHEKKTQLPDFLRCYLLEKKKKKKKPPSCCSSLSPPPPCSLLDVLAWRLNCAGFNPPTPFYDVHWLNTDFYKCFPSIITVSAWWLHRGRSWSNPPRTRQGEGWGGLLQFNYLEKHKVLQDGSFSHILQYLPLTCRCE